MTNSYWSHQSKILAKDGVATSDCFGISAFIYGNNALIGAYGDDDKGTDAGMYV